MNTCYLDVDGVLTDFMGAALRLHGRTTADVYAGDPSHWRWGVWGMLGLTAEAFWEPITSAGAAFWRDLAWTPEGRDLVDVVEQVFGQPNVYLLTSPSDDPYSLAGKTQWVKQHLPQYARQTIVTPAKHAVAAEGRLLIDDSDDNCAKWAKAGGRAILFPRPWNVNLRYADRALDETIINLGKAINARFIYVRPRAS